MLDPQKLKLDGGELTIRYSYSVLFVENNTHTWSTRWDYILDSMPHTSIQWFRWVVWCDLSDCLSVCLFVCLFVCLSVCLSVCLFVCLYVCMYVCLSVCVCVCLFVCLSLSICLSVCLFVCLYSHLYACLSHIFLIN